MKSSCKSKTRWPLSQKLLTRMLSSSSVLNPSCLYGMGTVMYEAVERVILEKMQTAMIGETIDKQAKPPMLLGKRCFIANCATKDAALATKATFCWKHRLEWVQNAVASRATVMASHTAPGTIPAAETVKTEVRSRSTWTQQCQWVIKIREGKPEAIVLYHA